MKPFPRSAVGCFRKTRPAPAVAGHPFPPTVERPTMPTIAPPRPLLVALLVAAAWAVVAPSAGLGAEAKKPGAKKARAAVPFRLPAAVRDAPDGASFAVAPIDRTARDSVRVAAARIDALLAERHARDGVVAPPSLSDSQFLRRAYLDLGGRIPTHDEASAFLASTDPDKRGALVDSLLESPDWVSRFYNVWADTLRLTERPQKNLWSEAYLDWVKRSIAANRPYDEWVHDMLTADGKLWENPAVGYQLRDQGMPLPYVDNTVRVFLGTQIGCAQCHNHPFDAWTQHQFYELAAFTAGTRSGTGGKPEKPVRKEMRKGARADTADATAKNVRALIAESRKRANQNGTKVNNAFTQFLQANGTVVTFRDRDLKLPHDYQYDDAKPEEGVAPHVLWGEVPQEARSLDGRAQFAAWVTSRDNPQFARTIANRMWKLCFGVGLVEPIDDFRPDNPPSHPELMDHLAAEMLRLDFDLREFFRIVVSTEAWQRRAIPYDPTTGEAFSFAAPSLRRQSAEQLWDSILALVAHDPWAYERPTGEAFAAAVNLDLSRKNPGLDAAHAAFERYEDSQSPRKTRRQTMQTYGYKGQLLARASELPTPLPLGHFLRQFGQGDRETIDGNRTVATVPQILAMFNGPITHAMLERGSTVVDELAEHDPPQAVDVIFLSVLSRLPDEEDRQLALGEIRSAADRRTGCGNLIWALLNTREFLFIQ